jgi:hypothetical protein
MSGLSTYTVESVSKLRARIEKELQKCSSFQAASQTFANTLYDELATSMVLLRVFATVPYGSLPNRERTFALEAARARGRGEEVQNETTVVTLLGTRGKRGGWNDRYLSKRHLAIPLTSASFIQTIPMVSRLMSDMGTGLEWVEKQHLNMVVKTTGRMARVLYVEDAATAMTADGFKVVPDQDFVEDHGVQTVLGLGGAYLNRTIVAILLFTNELIPQDRVEKFMPLVHGFKVATMKVVMKGQFFS